MKKTILILGLFLVNFGTSKAQELIDLLKNDLNKEKRALIGEAMTIKEEHKTAFWVVYSQHETVADKLVDLRAKNIKLFAKNYDNLSSEITSEVAKNYFEIENSRLKNDKTTYKKMKKIVGAIKASQFIQIMSQVQLLIDLQIANEMPLIK